MITFREKLPKSKQPSSNSYVVIKDVVKDLFLPAKLHFFVFFVFWGFFFCFFLFCYIAGIGRPFLKEYHTDIPMIPFLYFDLKAVISS